MLYRVLWLSTMLTLTGCACSGGATHLASAHDAEYGLDASGSADGGTRSDTTDASDRIVDAGRSSDGSTGSSVLDAMSADAATVLPRVLISEIVAYPVSDLSRSDRSGAPFAGGSGSGAVNGRDQLIELYNADREPVDLRGWTLEMRDTSSATLDIESHDLIAITAGSSIDALAPGHFLVLGDPPDFLSTDGYFVLRNATGEVIDDVEIGGLVQSRDFENDGVGDGAPDSTWNGFARGAFDEAIARPFGAVDTDDDALDFDRMPATPLDHNIVPDPPVESAPPFALDATLIGVDGVMVRMSEPVLASSVDPAVELLADGVPVDLGFVTFRDRDATIEVNPIGRLPFEAHLTLRLRGGATGIRDLAGNAMSEDIEFSLVTEAEGAGSAGLLINEICASPQQDWDDTISGNGIAHDDMPGSGRVDYRDDWVELLHRGTETLDVSDYVIVVYSGPTLYQAARRLTRLGDSSVAARVFGTGTLSNVQPGDRVVVGGVSGGLGTSLWLALRDSEGHVIDHVELGGNTRETDRGGDGIRNGAPGPGLDGSSNDLTNEVIARIPDGRDTDDDESDWEHAPATIGAPN